MSIIHLILSYLEKDLLIDRQMLHSKGTQILLKPEYF